MQEPIARRNPVEHVLAVADRRGPVAAARAAVHILVVNDEENSAESSVDILAEEGHRVLAVSTAAAALRYMKDHAVDLVLVNIVMPGMDGMQFLAQSKELYPDTDVIVLTNFGTIEDAVEAIRRGAADFLPKPFLPRDLKRVVASILQAREANRDRAFCTQSAAVLELAALLARTTDLRALPSQAVEMACAHFAADCAALVVYDELTQRVSVLAHAGHLLSTWGATEDIAAQARETVRTGKLLLSADAQTGDCYAYAPLRVNGRTRGVLCLRRRGGPWYPERSADLLQIFASHLALSLETARLYDTAAQKVSDLEELLSVSRTLGLENNVESASRRLLEGARRLTDADLCAVLLTGSGAPCFRMVPAEGADSSLGQALQDVMARVMGSATPTQSASAGLPPALRRRLTSFLSVPIESERGRVGLLAVGAEAADRFTLDHAHRLSVLASHAAAALDNASTLERVSHLYVETLEMIANLVDSTHVHCAGHSRQVRTYAGELARALRLPSDEVYAIEDGALLHDIGKLCVPRALLDKPSPLTAEEFALVASHAERGADMFKSMRHLEDIAPIIRHHHEHYDGSGYPDGLSGSAIPLGARIVALGDVFDALVSHRVYRTALSCDTARAMLREKAGAQFDPELTDVFLKLPLEDLVEH